MKGSFRRTKAMVIMMQKPGITRCTAREILDSRGNPTVEATVFLNDGTVGVASVPSGASTGEYEAHELRDTGMRRYGGRGVLDAVCNVCRRISPAVAGVSVCEQYELDRILIELDGTRDKSSLGANAMLAVSLAAARAAANWYGLPVYRYLGGAFACRLPVPMMNIMNGGAHASNNIEIQEFMIVPTGASCYSEALRCGSEIYRELGTLLRRRGLSTAVGDEGGYAPDLDSDEEALELIVRAIGSAGYDTENVRIALDVAASEWFNSETGVYDRKKRGGSRDTGTLIGYISELCEKYPIVSVEDGLDQNDFSGWSHLTEKLGDSVMLVGDDLFVTNTARLKKGIYVGAGNAVLVKPNQIGTLSETLDVIRTARDAGYRFVLSHRSGETEDTTLSDIAVATGAPFIKSGAPCRGERVAKYNRLLRIESSLNSSARYY